MSESTQQLKISNRSTFFRIPLPLFGAIVVLGSLLVMLIFGLLAYQIFFLERAHLGVQIDGIAIDTLTRSEVEQLVIQRAEGLLNRPITLRSTEGSWTLPASELGARVDVEGTTNLAFTVGRRGVFIGDLKSQYKTAQEPINIELIIQFDSGPANIVLAQIADEINRPPKNAALRLNEDLTVTLIPAEVGSTVDIETTRAAIQESIIHRGQATIDLKVDYVEPVITEVEPTHQLVERLLSQPFVFSFENQNWTLSQADIGRLISFGQMVGDDGIGRVTAQIDTAPLYSYFQNLAIEVYQPPINAWFDFDPDTGLLEPIVPSQDQHSLDIEKAVALVTTQLDRPAQHQHLLPIIIEPPAVPMQNPDQLGIRELVSASTSYFKGSSTGRMKNIAVSASKFHGLVIPPGQIFSFNEYLGEVTTENGFVESLIIRGDRTAVGIGGGVCQVSTTVFRTAFYGGFEIVERWAHGYRVSWYETGSGPGLDATIYSPTVDFKFRNDTDSYLLIQTHTDLDAGTVSFNFYGTASNRKVTVSDPVEENHLPHGDPIYEEDPSLKPGEVQQVDWAKDGVDVTVYRTVTEGETVIHQDTIFSRYYPWQAVYRVGPTEN